MANYKKLVDIALKQVEQSYPKKLTNAVGAVVTAPKVNKYNKLARQASRDADLMKNAQRFNGMPDFDINDGVTEGFKARSLASDVPARNAKRIKKLTK